MTGRIELELVRLQLGSPKRRIVDALSKREEKPTC